MINKEGYFQHLTFRDGNDWDGHSMEEKYRRLEKRIDIDLLNNEFYNEYVDSFDKIPFEDVLIRLILNYLPKTGCNILEIGSGAGALALWMKELGHNITCIEPAEKPAEKARLKGLNVCKTRLQDYFVTHLTHRGWHLD